MVFFSFDVLDLRVVSSDAKCPELDLLILHLAIQDVFQWLVIRLDGELRVV